MLLCNQAGVHIECPVHCALHSLPWQPPVTKEKSGLPQLVKNFYRIALVASILLQ